MINYWYIWILTILYLVLAYNRHWEDIVLIGIIPLILILILMYFSNKDS